jgi:hypothetical protein
MPDDYTPTVRRPKKARRDELGPIFRNQDGKYICAVYDIRIPLVVSMQWIAQNIFPESWGYSVTAWGLFTDLSESRWTMLVNNRRQTTRADIMTKLTRKLQLSSTQIIVTPIAGVPEQGQQDNTGTPRTGSRRTMRNSTDAEKRMSVQ